MVSYYHEKSIPYCIEDCQPLLSPTHSPQTHAQTHRNLSKSYSLLMHAVAEFASEYQLLLINSRVLGGFCKFCSELGRPMGTKSHISKALPASIMSKRIGLMVLLWVTFRTGCFYLSFPGHFLYVCQLKSLALMHSCIGNNTEEIWRLSAISFCLILFCCTWNPWSISLGKIHVLSQLSA